MSSSSSALAENICRIAKERGPLYGQNQNLNIFNLPLELTFCDNENKLQKYELGTPRSDKKTHQIMLMGFPRCGKNRMINNLINYIYGVKFEDSFRFEGAVGKPTWITNFSFNWQEGFRIPYSLIIIDTPEIVSPQEYQDYNEAGIFQMYRFIENEVLCPAQELSLVGLVSATSEKQMSDLEKEMAMCIPSLLGINLANNFVKIIASTMMNIVRDEDDIDSGMPLKLNGVNIAKFKFDINAIFATNDDSTNKESWNSDQLAVEKFLNTIEGKPPRSLANTRQVIEGRKKHWALSTLIYEKIVSGPLTTFNKLTDELYITEKPRTDRLRRLLTKYQQEKLGVLAVIEKASECFDLVNTLSLAEKPVNLHVHYLGQLFKRAKRQERPHKINTLSILKDFYSMAERLAGNETRQGSQGDLHEQAVLRKVSEVLEEVEQSQLEKNDCSIL